MSTTIKEAIIGNVSGKSLYQAIAAETNSFSLKPRQVAESIYSDNTAKKRFSMIADSWFKKLANVRSYDDRNEDSVLKARLIESYDIRLVKTDTYADIADDTTEIAVYRLHKTLQQSFNKICLQFLDLLSKDGHIGAANAVAALSEKYGEYWKSQPFI